jgi:hypothetical protein
VAGQIYYTNKAIREALKEMPETNCIYLKYEKFCQEPRELLQILSEKYIALGESFDLLEGPLDPFSVNNKVQVSPKRWEDILEAVEFFQKKSIS